MRQCHITSIYGSFHVRSGQHPPAWSGSRTVGKRDGLGSALYRGVGRSLQNTISRNAYQLGRKPNNSIARGDISGSLKDIPGLCTSLPQEMSQQDFHGHCWICLNMLIRNAVTFDGSPRYLSLAFSLFTKQCALGITTCRTCYRLITFQSQHSFCLLALTRLLKANLSLL